MWLLIAISIPVAALIVAGSPACVNNLPDLFLLLVGPESFGGVVLGHHDRVGQASSDPSSSRG